MYSQARSFVRFDKSFSGRVYVYGVSFVIILVGLIGLFPYFTGLLFIGATAAAFGVIFGICWIIVNIFACFVCGNSNKSIKWHLINLNLMPIVVIVLYYVICCAIYVSISVSGITSTTCWYNNKNEWSDCFMYSIKGQYCGNRGINLFWFFDFENFYNMNDIDEYYFGDWKYAIVVLTWWIL